MQELINFKGIKVDTPDKATPPEYFRRLENFNQDSIAGFDQVLLPSVEQEVGGCGYGFIQYRYLDSNNIEQDEVICVFDGSLYRCCMETPELVVADLAEADYDMQIYKDELYLATAGQNTKIYNGENQTVRDLGSPEALISGAAGVVSGTYKYTMTYIKGGIERVIEAYSNTVSPTLSQITLNLPIGYDGVTSRKIYRNKDGDLDTFYLLTTVADNTTLTYTDNTLDADLGAEISGTTLAQPQGNSVITTYDKLIVAGDPKYPTQVFISEQGLKIFDTTIYLDISNQGDDNSPIRSLGKGYDKVYAWSDLQHYVVDVSTETNTTRSLQTNIGILARDAWAPIPKDAGVEAGVLFYASDFTLRNAVGNFKKEDINSLDNISAGNEAQRITKNLKDYGYDNVKSIYYENKYHLAIPDKNKVITFDIRTNSFHEITDVNVTAWAIIDRELYSQTDDGNIEKWYQSINYRGEYLGGYVESPSIAVSEGQKKINKIYFWINEERRIKCKCTIIIEDDYDNPIEGYLEVNGGDFSRADFFFKDFLTNVRDDDYRVFHINRYGRWLKYILEPEEGRIQVRTIAFDISNADDEEAA